MRLSGSTTQVDKNKRHRRIMPLLVVAFLFLGLSASPAFAGNGSVATARVGNPANGTAIDVTLDNRWVPGDGYRPIRITAKVVGGVAPAYDREINLQLRPYQQRVGSKRIIRKSFEMKGGQRTLSTTIYVPEDPDTDSYGGSVKIGNGRSKTFSLRCNNSSNVADSTPRILVLDVDAIPYAKLGNNASSYAERKATEETVTNPSGLIAATPIMYTNIVNNNRWDADRKWYEVVDQIPNCIITPPEDIPANWIGLTNLDIIVASLDDLETIQSNPRQWQPIIKWTANGGNLFITGCRGKRNAVHEMLDLPEFTEGENPVDYGWKFAQKTLFGKSVDALSEDRGRNNRNGRQQNIAKANEKAPSSPMSFRDYQFGTVVLFSDDNPLAKSSRAYWEWVFGALGKKRFAWIERHGMSGSRDNRGVWTFMVPGVGLAPVKTFVFLLSMFVLFIGPVSFVVLNRWKRPNWLMFTVPLAALFITFGLIGYALTTDGLGVRGRVRNITHLDQRAGREATWSRQAYYAGLPPAGGVHYGSDVAAYPIHFSPYAQHMPDRDIDLTNDQHFNRGYLRARETLHFMVQRCRNTKSKIEVDCAEEGSTCNVTNRLGSSIRELYVQDKDGKLFHGENIADGKTVSLEPMLRTELTSQMLDLGASRSMVPPEGVDPNDIQLNRGGIFGYRSYYNWNQYQADNDPKNCVVERLVSNFSYVKPKSYLAVLEGNESVPQGLKKVRWDQSENIVVGEW